MFVVGVYLPQPGCKTADYQEHLDVLEYIVEQSSLEGDVIVIGDFNAHFGVDEPYSRGRGKSSTNGKKLLNMMDRCALTPVDMLVQCTGPTHTFENERGHVSYVDHCLVSDHCVNDVTSCEIVDDVMNTSDHLAIVCMLTVLSIGATDQIRNPRQGPKVAWHKMTVYERERLYSEVVDNKLMNSELLTKLEYDNRDTRECITKAFHELENVMKSASKNLPSIKYNRHLKPYWHRGLTESTSKKKQAWHRWADAGKPRNDHPTWIEYKEAKRVFRRIQRQASLEHEIKYLNEVARTHEIDQRTFWQLINKRRRPKSQPHPVINKEGNTAREIGDIVEVWGKYYTDLYTPTESEAYDNGFRDQVDREIREEDMIPQDGDSDILKSPITTEEVQEPCKSLKVGKAPGLDGIQPEHLKYGGPIMHIYLAKLFNIMTEAEWRPPVMRKGIIVPIPKGNKDPTVPDNNRGITLRSVVGKTYDKILLCRANDWFEGVCDDQQGANRSSCSSIHTALILRENVAHNLNKGSAVYTVLLDTKKAFDTVWQNGLFYKLKQYGMDKKLWRILKGVYDNFECTVNIAGRLSEFFHPQQGVHQGDIFSMKLYGVFNNGLLIRLDRSQNGATIDCIRCGNPAFADDIAIVALSKMALNSQLRTAYLYSCRWRFSFNASKTQVLVFKGDKRPNMPNTPVKLGEDAVEQTEKCSHLGIPMYTTEKCEDVVITERINACRKCFFAIEGIGSGGRGFDPTTLSTLYLAICLPKLIYGMETWKINDKNRDRLENFHNDMGRRVQKLPPLSARPVNYALLGWKCIQATIDKNRLVFLVQLLRLPVTLLVCKLAIRRLSECRFANIHVQNVRLSPIACLYNTAKKYGLCNDIHNMLDSGNIPSKQTWKQKAAHAVDVLYSERWIVECHLYSSLSTFVEVVPKQQLCIWWKVCKINPIFKWQCITLVKLVTGNHNLNTGRRQYVSKTKNCQMCDVTEESIEHVLFECAKLTTRREALWSDVISTMPAAMATEISRMSAHHKVIYILGGLNSGYIAEWNEVYLSILRFVSGLYTMATEMRPPT